MATADVSIFQGLLQPPRSVADYTMQNQKVQEGALQLKQLQQAGADADALREATKSFNDDPLNNLANLRRAGLYKPAQDYQKSTVENAKTQGEIGLNRSKASEQDALAQVHALDASIKGHDFALQKPAGIQRLMAVAAGARANLDGNATRKLTGLEGVSTEELDECWHGTWKKTTLCNKGRGFGSSDERVGGAAAHGIAADDIPLCPACKIKLTFRPGKGDRGAFWGCRQYKNHPGEKVIVPHDKLVEELKTAEA